MEENVKALFADINARRIDDALKLYDDSYVFLAAFSELEFSKAELTDFFLWDQTMEASFAIQRIWSSPKRPNEVFVEFVETSPFYAVLGVEGRDVLMMFVFGEDHRVSGVSRAPCGGPRRTGVRRRICGFVAVGSGGTPGHP